MYSSPQKPVGRLSPLPSSATKGDGRDASPGHRSSPQKQPASPTMKPRRLHPHRVPLSVVESIDIPRHPVPARRKRGTDLLSETLSSPNTDALLASSWRPGADSVLGRDFSPAGSAAFSPPAPLDGTVSMFRVPAPDGGGASRPAPLSFRTVIREQIDLKLQLCRASTPHREHLDEYAEGLVDEQRARHREAGRRIRALTEAHLAGAPKAVRVRAIRERAEALDANRAAVRCRKAESDEAYYNRLQDKFDQDVINDRVRQEEAVVSGWSKHVTVAVFAIAMLNKAAGRGNSLALSLSTPGTVSRLVHSGTFSSDGRRKSLGAVPLLPPVDLLHRQLRDSWHTLDRYIMAQANRERAKRNGLFLIHALSMVYVRIQRARREWATRAIRRSLPRFNVRAPTVFCIWRFTVLLRRAQTRVRNFVLCSRARRELVRRYLNKVYHDMWTAARPHQKQQNRQKPLRVRALPVELREQLVCRHVAALRRNNYKLFHRFKESMKIYLGLREKYKFEFMAANEALVPHGVDPPRRPWWEIEAFIKASLVGTLRPSNPFCSGLPPRATVVAHLKEAIAAMDFPLGYTLPNAALRDLSNVERMAVHEFKIAEIKQQEDHDQRNRVLRNRMAQKDEAARLRREREKLLAAHAAAHAAATAATSMAAPADTSSS